METVTYFIFLGSKITENGDCTHETKKQNKTFSLEENYDKSRQHFKSRNITLPMKVHIVKAVFCLFVLF